MATLYYYDTSDDADLMRAVRTNYYSDGCFLVDPAKIKTISGIKVSGFVAYDPVAGIAYPTGADIADAKARRHQQDSYQLRSGNYGDMNVDRYNHWSSNTRSALLPFLSDNDYSSRAFEQLGEQLPDHMWLSPFDHPTIGSGRCIWVTGDHCEKLNRRIDAINAKALAEYDAWAAEQVRGEDFSDWDLNYERNTRLGNSCMKPILSNDYDELTFYRSPYRAYLRVVVEPTYQIFGAPVWDFDTNDADDMAVRVDQKNLTQAGSSIAFLDAKEFEISDDPEVQTYHGLRRSNPTYKSCGDVAMDPARNAPYSNRQVEYHLGDDRLVSLQDAIQAKYMVNVTNSASSPVFRAFRSFDTQTQLTMRSIHKELRHHTNSLGITPSVPRFTKQSRAVTLEDTNDSVVHGFPLVDGWAMFHLHKAFGTASYYSCSPKEGEGLASVVMSMLGKSDVMAVRYSEELATWHFMFLLRVFLPLGILNTRMMAVACGTPVSAEHLPATSLSWTPFRGMPKSTADALRKTPKMLPAIQNALMDLRCNNDLIITMNTIGANQRLDTKRVNKARCLPLHVAGGRITGSKSSIPHVHHFLDEAQRWAFPSGLIDAPVQHVASVSSTPRRVAFGAPEDTDTDQNIGQPTRIISL
jgi:hypothetical protein